MSDTTPRKNGSPVNMDDAEERRKLIAEGFGASDDEDGSDVEGSVASNTPVASKARPQNKSMLNRLKSSKNAAPHQAQNQFANQNRLASGGVNASSGKPVNQTSDQMMGGVVKTPGSAYQVEGSNIGSKASEPDWTHEDLQAIANAEGARLTTVLVNDTRRSEPDPERKYLTRGNNDSVITKPPAILPNPSYNEYKLGIGRVKPDEKTGKSKLYTDVVMKGPNWLLSQWTSKNVILESVPDNILDKPPRMVNGRPERRIGHDFVRIGLPKVCFAPIFETLRTSMPSILDAVSKTPGYYWLNASWGVTGSPGNFIYKGEGGVQRNTHRLYEAMKLLGGMSGMGTGSIAVSVGNESRMEGGKMVPDPAKYELSIKIHNMFLSKRVPYHSPPQSSATGFEVEEDIFDGAETLVQNSGTSSAFDSTATAFGGGGINPFFGINAAVGQNSAVGPGTQGLLL